MTFNSRLNYLKQPETSTSKGWLNWCWPNFLLTTVNHEIHSQGFDISKAYFSWNSSYLGYTFCMRLYFQPIPLLTWSYHFTRCIFDVFIVVFCMQYCNLNEKPAQICPCEILMASRFILLWNSQIVVGNSFYYSAESWAFHFLEMNYSKYLTAWDCTYSAYFFSF